MLKKYLPPLILAALLAVFFLPMEKTSGDAMVRENAETPRSTPALDTPDNSAPIAINRLAAAHGLDPDANPASGSRIRFSSTPPPSQRHYPATPSTATQPDDIMAMAPASGIASPSALATLNHPCDAASSLSCPTEDRYFSNDYSAAPPYPELPAKGVRFWDETRAFREEQQTWQDDQYSDKHQGTLYTAGLNKDWSIDSVLGLTVNYLDSKVTPNRTDDYRLNTIRGYRIDGQYHGTYQAKFPFSFEAFYGQIENEGGGYYLTDDGATTNHWSENKHRSNYFGGKFRAGIPLVWGNEYKLYPEIGLDYHQLDSKPYPAAITSTDGDHYLETEKLISKSLQMPLALTIKKDFINCRGFLTPRLFHDTGTLKAF